MNAIEHVLWKYVQSDEARAEIKKVVDDALSDARREARREALPDALLRHARSLMLDETSQRNGEVTEDWLRLVGWLAILDRALFSSRGDTGGERGGGERGEADHG